MGDEDTGGDNTRLTGFGAGDETRLAGSTAAPAPAAPTPADATIASGSFLGHTYRIGALLARGGMGEVYRASHAELETEHAIKIILPELANDARIVDLFRREASVLRTIRHEAVVAYDGVFRDENGRLYLVMEFVDGPSLSKLMRERPFSADEVRQLRDRLANGLAVAHDKGVIHRDLSPDNVILPGGDIGQAKIIDFGISKLADPDAKTIIGTDFAGKYAYVSPEQLGMFGGQVDARSDIYSLGLVLAAAAQGEPLDMGLSPISVVEARRSVPDLSRVPEAVRADLAAMLQPDPADRPRSMRDLVPDSGRAARRGSAAARPATGRQAGSAGRIGAAVGALALLAVAGGAGYWYWSKGALPAGGETEATVETAETTVQIGDPQAVVAGADEPAAPVETAPEPATTATPSAPQPQAEEPVIAAVPTETAEASAGGDDPANVPVPQEVPIVAPEEPVSTDVPPAEAVSADIPSTEPPAEVSTVAAAEEPSALLPLVPEPEDTATAATPLPATTSPVATEPVEAPPQVQTAQLPRLPDLQRLREEANRTVESLSCAGVAVDVSETGDIVASGYVASEADRSQALALLTLLPEVGRVDDAVAVMPRPLCDALDVLRERTAFNLGQPRAPAIDPGGIDGVYYQDDHLLIDVAAPAVHDAYYLYVDYIDAAEGYVVHLLPNEMRRENRLGAGERVLIGSLPQEKEKYTVAPPFGSNLLIAVASRAPLFPGLRPLVEPADRYIAALREGLETAARQGDGPAAGYRSVVFKPR
jgi:hypothetical protein